MENSGTFLTCPIQRPGLLWVLQICMLFETEKRLGIIAGEEKELG